MQAELTGTTVRSVSLRPLLDRYVYEVGTLGGTVLFDAASGQRVSIDARVAQQIAVAAYAGDKAVKNVAPLDGLPQPSASTNSRSGAWISMILKTAASIYPGLLGFC